MDQNLDHNYAKPINYTQPLQFLIVVKHVILKTQPLELHIHTHAYIHQNQKYEHISRTEKTKLDITMIKIKQNPVTKMIKNKQNITENYVIDI